jgi:hypothetical protein
MTKSALYPSSYKEDVAAKLYAKGRVSTQKRAKEIDFSKKIPKPPKGFWADEARKVLDALNSEKLVEYEAPDGYSFSCIRSCISKASLLLGTRLGSNIIDGKLYFKKAGW